MIKEFGKELTRNQINKIAESFFLTKHAQERISERTNWKYNSLEEMLKKVHYEIAHCDYAFNNNDGTISVVLNNGFIIIVCYDDNYKKWHFVTIKELSENGYTARDKMELAQKRTRPKEKRKIKRKMTDYGVYYEHKEKKPYKRDKSWKGESW